ncbi:MAG: M50 family metallopeptidase [Planctomycetes bacterium]|nr:M50 family metallopeptidase [Planctomycetota bacterium]
MSQVMNFFYIAQDGIDGSLGLWDHLTFAFIMLGWIMLLLFASKLVENLWVRAIGFRAFRIFVAPGIIIHEYSHAIACILTRAKIREIKLFKRDGGHVAHEAPKWPPKFKFLSNVFISFAPVIGCILVMWFMIFAFDKIFPTEQNSLEDTSEVSKDDADKEVVESEEDGIDYEHPILDFGMSLFSSTWKQIINIASPIVKGSFWLGVIFLWLMLSLSVGMAPSAQDFKNSFIGIILIVILLLVVSWGITAFSADKGALINLLYGMQRVISFTIAIMAFAMGVSVVIAAPIGGLLRSSN